MKRFISLFVFLMLAMQFITGISSSKVKKSKFIMMSSYLNEYKAGITAINNGKLPEKMLNFFAENDFMINTANDTLFIKYETSSPNTEIRLDGSNISIDVAVWNRQNLRYVNRYGVNQLDNNSYTKNKEYIDLFIKYISSWNVDQIKKDSDTGYNVLGVSGNCKITRVIFHKGKIKTSTFEYEFIGFDKGSTVMGTKMDKTIIFGSFLDEVIIHR